MSITKMELKAYLPFGLGIFSSQKVSLIISVQEYMKLAASTVYLEMMDNNRKLRQSKFVMELRSYTPYLEDDGLGLKSRSQGIQFFPCIHILVKANHGRLACAEFFRDPATF